MYDGPVLVTIYPLAYSAIVLGLFNTVYQRTRRIEIDERLGVLSELVAGQAAVAPRGDQRRVQGDGARQRPHRRLERAALQLRTSLRVKERGARASRAAPRRGQPERESQHSPSHTASVRL